MPLDCEQSLLQSVESKLGRNGEGEMAERETGERREEEGLHSHNRMQSSGRKNVLRKLLRIPYCRLMADFSVTAQSHKVTDCRH